MVILKFDEKKHEYHINGEKALSVTQFVGSMFKPFDAKGLARKLANYAWAKAQKKGVRYWLKDWKERADYGTLVHNEIEDFINDKSKLTSMEEKTKRAIDYLDEHTNKVDSELRVCDEEIMIAGTIDLVAHNDDGTVTLVDWKTNAKMNSKPYEEGDYGLAPPVKHLYNSKINLYYLQLLMYSYIIEKTKGVIIKELQLVWLKDDKYVVIKYPVDKVLRQELISYRLDTKNRCEE